MNKVICDKFDLNTAMIPYWDNNVAVNESVMFMGKEGEANLLYHADEILSVRSFDLKREFKENIDYVYDKEKNIIKRIFTGSASYIEEDLYYSRNEAQPMIVLMTNRNGENVETYYNEEIYQHQVFITYKHSDKWTDYVQKCHKDTFKNLSGKLSSGDDITMMFLGDSITYGASATLTQNKEPMTPTWAMMVTLKLAEKYDYNVKFVDPGLPNVPPVLDDITGRKGGTITYINTAVGGWQVTDGISKYDEHVKPFIEKYGCDFFLLGFGMNDAWQQVPDEKKLQKVIIDRVLEQSPKAAVLLLSTMVPNPDATNGWYGRQAEFEPAMDELAKEYREKGYEVDMACMSSSSLSILKYKKFRDYTGNNINHPNDYFTRVYAQVVYQAVEGY